MKIGVSYNIFDGEELLEGSINTIKDSVDHITVVFQRISNFGAKCSDNIIHLLRSLKERGLVHRVVEYTPVIGKGGSYNELIKRNIGLGLSRENGCTHHLAMDADEYYLKDEFEYMKKVVEEGNYDSSACQMVTYYKSWEHRLDPPENYYVSLLFKINENTDFIFAQPFPVEVDPTRRMVSKNCKIFKREEIEMHHGSYIRNDIKIKLQNSSAKVAYNWDINKVSKYFDEWVDGKKGLLLKPNEEYVKLKKNKSLFV
tara:strand:- start:2094 stop:2864 length:771 start_codon:yes stop_codon:yes gene_type:complete